MHQERVVEAVVFAQPRRLFRVLALAEAVTWTLLLLGMLGKYGLGLGQLGVRIGGGLHGFVFLAYCVTTLLVGIDARWRPGTLVLGLLSAVIPYATVAFEKHAERAGLLRDTWRLRDDAPAGLLEKGAATALRRPLLAGVLALLAIGVVFGGLLAVGPPTQWGK